MSKIEFQTPAADLTGYALDKKGKEAEKVKLIHLTFECELSSEILKPLVISEQVPKLWDDNGDKLFHGISSIKSIAKFENHTVHINELAFENVELKSFGFVPIAQSMAKVGFKVTVSNPNEHQEAVLSSNFKESVALNVIAPEGDNLDENDQASLVD